MDGELPSPAKRVLPLLIGATHLTRALLRRASLPAPGGLGVALLSALWHASAASSSARLRNAITRLARVGPSDQRCEIPRTLPPLGKLQAAVQIAPVMAVEMSPLLGEPRWQGSLASPDGVGCLAQLSGRSGCPVLL